MLRLNNNNNKLPRSDFFGMFSRPNLPRPTQQTPQQPRTVMLVPAVIAVPTPITTAASTIPTPPPLPVTGVAIPMPPAAPPLPPLAPAATLTHPNLGHASEKWYILDVQKAIFLLVNFKRDLIWCILSQLQIGPGFTKTDNFGEQAAGQFLICMLFLTPLCFLTAATMAKLYDKKYSHTLMKTYIASVGAILTIIPWDYFALLGQKLFGEVGCDETAATYLAAIFPGPGVPDAFIQTIFTTLLSFLLDPEYKFNWMTFILGFTALNYISGDLWLILFTAMAGVAEKSVGGLIAQALVLATTVMIVEYFTLKIIDALTEAAKNCCGFKDHKSLDLLGLRTSNHRPRPATAPTGTTRAAARTTALPAAVRTGTTVFAARRPNNNVRPNAQPLHIANHRLGG